jgi:hypothetical protein
MVKLKYIENKCPDQVWEAVPDNLSADESHGGQHCGFWL